MKLTKIQPNEITQEAYAFYCPGCDNHHVYIVKSKQNYCWTFNGDMDKPTFSPSLLNKSSITCHLFVRDGRIEYCADSSHDLAGKTVEMAECKI